MLTPGTRLGSYEVTGSLGKGGMGEVYRARDTRLERDVALKVLPDDVASDRDRLARFEREARLLAALNHPHIAAIYGVEDVGSTHALVMELAEGPTLQERIAEGPMPVDEALDVARQMAGALEYAHEHGIVHRDLKPANVKVTPEGEVKLLDFGLAKALEAEGTEPMGDYSESPTISHQATRAGVILGTASYMSPEQARGKTVDRRADIWAFGVVLLEMLTGRKPFTGESLTDVLAAVVSSEPDLSTLSSTTPAAVRRLLKRCLDKDPKRRLRDVGEARVLLEGHDPPTEEAESPRQRPWLRVAAVPALALLAVAGPLLFLFGRLTAPSPAEGIRSTRLTFRRGSVVDARFGPDGQTVIYAAAWGGTLPELFSVRSDVRESRSLGLQGAGLLSVSSTSELAISLGYRNTIGFESTGTLARLPLGAGAPREVLENVQDAAWSPDGRALAVVRDIGGKRRLEYPIGQALYETGGWLSSIRVSPDGSLVAFQDHPNRGDNVAVVSVVDRRGTVRSLDQPVSTGVAWSPSGDEILAAHAGTIRAVSLSGRSRILYRELTTLLLLDISPEGRVRVGRTHDRREIVSLAPGEAEERNLSWFDWSFPSALANDGRTVFFEEQNLVSATGEYALFMRPTDGGPPTRLGDGRALDVSPDGRWVLTVVGPGGGNELVLVPTGVGNARRLGPISVVPTAAAFLPDGDRIILAGHAPGEGTRVYVRDLAGRDARPLSPEGVTVHFCRLLSPDGRRVFAVGPDGQLTVYPVDEGEPHVVPGTSYADLPIRWTEDGRGILVQGTTTLPSRIERVEVATGERTFLMELSPPDPAGVLVVGPVHLSADGRSYLYSYKRRLHELYVLDGIL